MHHSETHYEKTDKRRENTKQNTKNTKKVKDNKNAAAAHYFRDWLMRNFYFSLNLYGSRMFMNASFSMKYQHFCLNDVFFARAFYFFSVTSTELVLNFAQKRCTWVAFYLTCRILNWINRISLAIPNSHLIYSHLVRWIKDLVILFAFAHSNHSNSEWINNWEHTE